MHQRPLGYIDHNPVLRKRRQHAQEIKTADPPDRLRKPAKIRIFIKKQRSDVHVDQILHKPCPLNIAEHTRKDRNHHNNDVNRIIAHQIAHNPKKGLSWMRQLWTRALRSAPASFKLSYLFCHQLSPAFSSKSPPPFVWDS